MTKRVNLVWLALAMMAAGTAAAQVTGSGTNHTVPVFTGTSTIGNSPISVSGSNVGIGNASPTSPLTVGNEDSNVGGVPNDVFGSNPGSTPTIFELMGFDCVELAGSVSTSGNNPFWLQVRTCDNSAEPLLLNPAGGNVGIGTTSASQPLEVNGNVKIDGTVNQTGIIFPDGSQQVTAFIPANCGADFAESVGVTGERAKYGPGDLMVIDPEKPGKFLKAAEAYSTLAAGVYSTKPGFVGRMQPASDPASAGEIPMAMVGRVPTKVSAENGPIKTGDLLVTSSTPGYAMKGTDRSRMLGAVIGKALEPLDSGTGTIMVLVTLQ